MELWITNNFLSCSFPPFISQNWISSNLQESHHSLLIASLCSKHEWCQSSQSHLIQAYIRDLSILKHKIQHHLRLTIMTAYYMQSRTLFFVLIRYYSSFLNDHHSDTLHIRCSAIQHESCIFQLIYFVISHLALKLLFNLKDTDYSLLRATNI